MLYQPPTVQQLKQLKEELGYTGAQMAQLLGLSSSRRWRDLVNESNPQGVTPASLFLGAARLTLAENDIQRVLEKMRQIGAAIDLDAASDSPVPNGDQQL
ncbi:XRE family transcriptional regulator [Paraburkholderia azotifigens]|uniref:XRE family transcriptional regulator n=1 Tax=Paraburkholderia azotifigens TaxID=2057004 RepID=UPI0038B6C640